MENMRIALRNATPSRLKKIKKFETLLTETGTFKHIGKNCILLCVELRWNENGITSKEIVGYINFYFHPIKVGVFVNLFEVMPFFRGNKIGTMALGAMINLFQASGYKRITIFEVSKIALGGKNTEIYFWIKAFKRLGLPLIMEQGEKAGHVNFIINL